MSPCSILEMYTITIHQIFFPSPLKKHILLRKNCACLVKETAHNSIRVLYCYIHSHPHKKQQHIPRIKLDLLTPQHICYLHACLAHIFEFTTDFDCSAQISQMMNNNHHCTLLRCPLDVIFKSPSIAEFLENFLSRFSQPH